MTDESHVHMEGFGKKLKENKIKRTNAGYGSEIREIMFVSGKNLLLLLSSCYQISSPD